MKTTLKTAIAVSVISFALSSNSVAQTIRADSTDLFSLDLEGLMNIHIVSASKKSESLFDAPVSASVLSKEEIKRAGCTSIMEALRLMPGLIVREETNGNYDIHVRGLDGVPPNNVFTNFANNTTLVMVDDRPVYNYYQGGTFWETLPVDINDVERIEVVRGAASAMYGPNAATGVINIITARSEKKGLYAVANAQYGSNKTSIANASVGYKFNDKLSLMASGNYQQRNRSGNETSYYDVKSDSWISLDSIKVNQGPFSFPIADVNTKFPNRSRAMDRHAFNTFLDFSPSKSVKFNLSAGMEESEVQKVFGVNQITPLSTAHSNTNYVDLRGSGKGFTGQISYLGGDQTTTLGFSNQHFDFNTFDATLEYDFNYKNLSLKPGINYRKAVYDDRRYVNEQLGEGIFNGSRTLVTEAASLRGEYKAFGEKVRLIAGARVDKFNHPDKGYISHQLGINFKPSERHLFRITQSRAFRAPFMVDTYISMKAGGKIPIGPNKYISPSITGNYNLEPVTVDMLEIGYRGKITDNFYVDLEVFDMRAKNFNYVVAGTPTMSVTNGDTIITLPMPVSNIPTTAEQIGTTLSFNYTTHNFQFKPFITYQYSQLQKYSDYRNTATAAPSASNNFNPAVYNIDNGMTIRHKATPRVYGGAYVNYQLSSKFNINLNPYYLGSQTILYSDNLTYKDGIRGVEKLNSKLIINARLSFQPVKQLDLFLSGKNIGGKNSREFYKTDGIGSSYFAGMNFAF